MNSHYYYYACKLTSLAMTATHTAMIFFLETVSVLNFSSWKFKNICQLACHWSHFSLANINPYSSCKSVETGLARRFSTAGWGEWPNTVEALYQVHPEPSLTVVIIAKGSMPGLLRQSIHAWNPSSPWCSPQSNGLQNIDIITCMH